MQQQRGRIAVFTGHFLPHIGGVEIYSHELWRRVVDRGWRVLLVTSDVGGGRAEEAMDGIEVHRVPTLAIMGERFPIVLPTSRLSRVVGVLDDFRPTVAVTNLRFMPPCWLGAVYARRRKIPRLHIEHGSGHVPLRGRIGHWASASLDRTLGRCVVRSATRCVGVSETSAAFVASLGAVRPGILSMGVEAGPPDLAGRVRWRERLCIGKGATVALFLGRVTVDKGALVLLDAWKRLTPGPDAHLVIVGGGGALEEVRRRAGGTPRVHVVGPIPPAEVRSVMAASDVFVSPSLAAEGGPISILEAAEAGLPVIATPQGLAGDLLGPDRDGTLVEPGDVGALAAALGRLLGDAGARAALGTALRRKVLDTFAWDRVVDRAEAELLSTQTLGR